MAEDTLPDPLKEAKLAAKRAYMAKWSALPVNAAKKKARNVRYLADPANKAARDRYMAKWRQANKEHRTAYAAEWAAKNPEKVREYKRQTAKRMYAKDPIKRIAAAKASQAKKPLQYKAMKAARRARYREVAGACSGNAISLIFKAQKGKCAYCRSRLGNSFDVDHIIAISKGGTNWPRNLQLTCPHCNRTKSAKDPIDFAQSLGLLI